MTQSLSREQLVERARYMPKTWLGGVAVIGWLAALVALACLIGSAANRSAEGSLVIDWRVSLTALAVGAGAMVWAGWRIRRDLEVDATASGFSKQNLVAIEDEAERLNEEEN